MKPSINDMLTPVYYPHKDRTERCPDGRARGACQCGVHSVYDTLRPLTKGKQLEYASNLSMTLEELDVEFDMTRLLQVVHERATTPSTTKRVDETMEIAIKEAVDKAQERHAFQG